MNSRKISVLIGTCVIVESTAAAFELVQLITELIEQFSIEERFPDVELTLEDAEEVEFEEQEIGYSAVLTA